jgi:Flp pilus assembly pilin Flp
MKRKRLSTRRGQTLVEYALIIAFISVVAISVLIRLGSAVSAAFTTTKGELQAAQTGGASGGR